MSRGKFDEIGYWSEMKLDIVQKYATAYSKILDAEKRIKAHVYVDAFAGSGVHISKTHGGFVLGSPINALNVQPPFKEFHFIDLDGDKVARLEKVIGNRKDVTVHQGDCNQVLLDKVFPRCRWDEFRRALCLLDPYSINLDWRVLQTAGKMRSVEVFYNFMIMDVNMNVLWRNPDKVAAPQQARMDAVWGDHSWREIAYRKQPTLFGDEEEEKVSNDQIAEAFRKRLHDVAGFEYVPEPIPMRNSTGAIIYYLFFASPNKTGAKIVKDIFDKYRRMGVR